MKYFLNEHSKTVELWLTREEEAKFDMDEMRPLFHSLKEAHYQPVVYISGTEDLYETMRGLVFHNVHNEAQKPEKPNLDSVVTDATKRIRASEISKENKTHIER